MNIELDLPSNINYKSHEKVAKMLADNLQERDDIRKAIFSKRTVELPDDATKTDKIVDAPYVIVNVRLRNNPRHHDEDISYAVDKKLGKRIAVKHLDDGEIEFHLTYNLEGGRQYAPLLEQNVSYR